MECLLGDQGAFLSYIGGSDIQESVSQRCQVYLNFAKNVSQCDILCAR